ncbi:hypothetical protein CEXT_116341 [Caerostris extrusa]|uniref:Uncharacterized protein n=1 Tax=Caerostris extrusa TaxID=172846 RepID=A0AAV4WX52_CAEEX|nr:hypothetical protein CEXT_116341 [Caerostris extrusa]
MQCIGTGGSIASYHYPLTFPALKLKVLSDEVISEEDFMAKTNRQHTSVTTLLTHDSPLRGLCYCRWEQFLAFTVNVMCTLYNTPFL